MEHKLRFSKKDIANINIFDEDSLSKLFCTILYKINIFKTFVNMYYVHVCVHSNTKWFSPNSYFLDLNL